jgi:hypothetical protein
VVLTPAVPAKGSRGAQADTPVRLGANKDQWLFKDKRVPLEQLEFDFEARQGQIRPLSADLLRKRRDQMNKEEPLGPINVLLVAKDISGVFMGCWLGCSLCLNCFLPPPFASILN